MKLYLVRITGVGALLQHRFGEDAEMGAQTRKVQIKDEAPRDAAERTAYRMTNGQLYLPGAAIARLLREAGAGHKQTGSRKSTKWLVPAAVLVNADQIPLFNGSGEPAMDFEVDSRPVTIPATKGKIMRHRARVEPWSAEFALTINETVLEPKFINQLLSEGGMQQGVGDFRPEKGGPFGTFTVTHWQEQKS